MAAAGQHWAFSRRQAVAAGASGSACHRRIAAGLWVASRHAGVYRLAGHPETWQQRLVSALLAAPAGAVASHRSAAVLLGLREGTPIELTVVAGTHSIGGARLHRGPLPSTDRIVVVGVPCTRVERTLVDLAGVVEAEPLEQALEAALRLGLTTDERVRRRLDELAAPGRAGVRTLRRVLGRRARGRAAGSELEVRVIQLLRAAGLDDPVRQFEVVVGASRYFVDLAYPNRRLAIELDGLGAHTGVNFQGDRARQNALVLAGWTVLRFTWADVAERHDEVVAAIARAMAA